MIKKFKMFTENTENNKNLIAFDYILNLDYDSLKKWLDDGGDINATLESGEVKDNLLLFLLYNDNNNKFDNKILSIIKLLIDYGIDVNYLDSQDNALTLSLSNCDVIGYDPFFYLVENENIDINQILNDDNQNVLNRFFTLNLRYTNTNMKIKIFKKLIEKGCDINNIYTTRGNNKNISSLIFLTRNENGSNRYELYMEILLENENTDWNIKDSNGYDFLDYLSVDDLDYVIKKYPKKYKKYLSKKRAKKFKI